MSRECEKCCYFGTVADAPETAEPECMWTPSEEDGWELPCQGQEVLSGDVLSINNEYRSYSDYKAAVDTELQKSAESFVRIGYLLKLARDTDILKGSTYSSVNEFAQAEYGLDKTKVSRFIRINDEYSEGGYSDHLQEKYQGYGYAKLAIMLMIPSAINEELSVNFSKAEIQTIKDEVDEEKKVSDLEVLMEQKDESKEDMGVFAKVLHQLGHDKPELYLQLYDAVDNTVHDGSLKPVINKLVDVLAPAGEAIHIVRIPGEGRKMLSIKGADIGPTVIDIRSNEKESCSWEDFITDIESLCEGWEAAGGKESWKILYGEDFPEKEESKPAAVPEKKKEEKKKPSKVSKAKVAYKDENNTGRNAEKQEHEDKSGSSEHNGSDGSSHGEEQEASGQTGYTAVPDGDTEEPGSEQGTDEEQLPGQMQLEKDFPEYCPEEKVEVAPVQPQMLTFWKEDGTWGINGYDIKTVPRELYGLIYKLHEYEKTGLQPEQIVQLQETVMEGSNGEEKTT